MASPDVVSATALSVEALLTRCLRDSGAFGDPPPAAHLVQTNDFGSSPPNQAFATATTKVSVYPYRVDINPTTRAAWSAVSSLDGVIHLPLDLHLLITAWAPNARTELELIGQVMTGLEATPTLSGPLLHPAGGWTPNESIQLVHHPLDLESSLRIFDTIPGDYRLSVTYVARVGRIDARGRIAPDAATVAVEARPRPTVEVGP
ncbi:MAG: DUF4255 domain-containing protein [Acidimicrobiales bacterium]